MSTDCSGGADVATSQSGQIEHPNVSDVLRHYAIRALAETRLTLNEFSEGVAVDYEKRVPEHARDVSIAAPTSDTAREFARELGAVRKRIERMIKGELYIPADLQEAWAFALPEPYSTQCRVTLTRRLGFIGAERPDAGPQRCDGSVLRSISSTSSGGMQAIVRLLEDGVIDERDAPDAPAAFTALDDLIAAARSAQARICTQTGYCPEPFRVLQGGVSA